MYSTKDTASLFNITERTIRYYDNEGIVTASLRKNSHRYFSREKITELFVVLFLKKSGYSLSKIRTEMKNSDDIHTLFKNAVAYKEKEISRDIGMVKSIKELLNYYSEQDVHSIKEMAELEQLKSDTLARSLSPDELKVVHDISKIQAHHEMEESWQLLIDRIRTTHDYQGNVEEWFRLLDISFQGHWKIILKIWQLEEKHEMNFSELIDDNIKKNMRVFLYQKLEKEGYDVSH